MPEPPEPAPADPPAAVDLDSTTDVSALRREAASRRVALREVETERDALRQRVDAQDRSTVDGLLAAKLRDPTDFWTATTLDDLRDDHGLIDVDRAEAAVAKLLREKPHYSLEAPTPTPTLTNGARATAPTPPSFGEEMRRQLGR